MGKTRRKYTKEFKLSVIREIESGAAVSELARKHNIHPALPPRWKKEYYEDQNNSFSGNGNTYKGEAVEFIVNKYIEFENEPELKPEFIAKMRGIRKEKSVKVDDFEERYGLNV